MIHLESVRRTSRKTLALEFFYKTCSLSFLSSQLSLLSILITEDTSWISSPLVQFIKLNQILLTSLIKEVVKLEFVQVGFESEFPQTFEFETWSCNWFTGNQDSHQLSLRLLCSSKLWVCWKRFLWTFLLSKGLQHFFQQHPQWHNRCRVLQQIK